MTDRMFAVHNIQEPLMRFIKTKLIHLIIIGGFVTCISYYWPELNPRNSLTEPEFIVGNHEITEEIQNSINGEGEEGVRSHKSLSLSKFNIHDVTLMFLQQFQNPCFHEGNIPSTLTSRYDGYKNNEYYKRDGLPEKFATFQRTIVNTKSRVCENLSGCRLRCLPYFTVLGSSDLLTSALYDDVSNHIDVKIPMVPETEFWSKYRFQGACLNDYMDLYDNVTNSIYKTTISDPNRGSSLITGEYNSIYTLTDPKWNEDPRNKEQAKPIQFLAKDLHGLLPNLKFIILLSEPVAHIYWHYNNAPFGRGNKSPEEFHERVIKSLQWFRNCTQTQKLSERACVSGNPPEMDAFEDRSNPWWPKSRYAGTIRDGIYEVYLRDLLDVYSRNNILFLTVDEYLKDQSKTLDKLFLFLDIQTDKVKPNGFIQSQFQSSNKFKPMLLQTEKLLNDFFHPFNFRLAELLQDDKYIWNK